MFCSLAEGEALTLVTFEALWKRCKRSRPDSPRRTRFMSPLPDVLKQPVGGQGESRRTWDEVGLRLLHVASRSAGSGNGDYQRPVRDNPFCSKSRIKTPRDRFHCEYHFQDTILHSNARFGGLVARVPVFTMNKCSGQALISIGSSFKATRESTHPGGISARETSPPCRRSAFSAPQGPTYGAGESRPANQFTPCLSKGPLAMSRPCFLRFPVRLALRNWARLEAGRANPGPVDKEK